MRNKIVRRGLAGLGVIIGVIALFCLYVAVAGIPTYDAPKPELHVVSTPEKVAAGARIASNVCIGCHRDAVTGQLTGRVVVDVPTVFGSVVSRNLTHDKEHGIGGWTDGQLAGMIRCAISPDGQFSPFMGPRVRLADPDVEALIAWLRSDDPLVAASPADAPGHTAPSFVTKLLTRTVLKAPTYPTQPIPRPAASDPVALGRYLATDAMRCYGCHSEDFATEDHDVPEKTPGYFGGGNYLMTLDGTKLFSANLTADEETGIGRWTKEEFRRALIQGIRADGRALRAPMGAWPGMLPDEADAIYAFLKTIPKIRREVDRTVPTAAAGDPPGRAVYTKAACRSCHGEDGIGNFTLHDVNAHFPDDQALRAFIQNPTSVRPLATMPVYGNTLSPEELDAVMKYVRTFKK